MSGCHWENIVVSGISTRYLRGGCGPPLVLLHGTGDSASDWQGMYSKLAQKYSLFAPDLPLRGKEMYFNEKYTSNSLAAFICNFLDLVGVEETTIVGHSLGGLVALRIALERPDRVGKLILMASAGLGKEIDPTFVVGAAPLLGDVTVLFDKTPIGRMKRMFARAFSQFGNPLLVPFWWLLDQDRLSIKKDFLEANLGLARTLVDCYGQREVLLDRLWEVQAPTLVLWGLQDRVLPPHQAQRAVQLLPKAELCLFPRFGHLLTVEGAEECAEAIIDFLSENRASQLTQKASQLSPRSLTSQL